MAEPLDSEAVGRIVRRAVDLDTEANRDVDGGVDPAAIISAATEVGVDPEAVREAIAWERLGDEPHPGRLDVVVGHGLVVASRRVDHDADSTMELLDDWLARGHHLRREVGDGRRAEWRRRSDVVASVQRRVRSIAGDGALSTVRHLVVQVVEVDRDRSVVRIVADRRSGRRASMVLSGGVGAASLGVGALAATAVPPLGLVALPGVVAAGATAASSRARAGRLERDLLRLLDQVARADGPSSIVGGALERLRPRRS